MSRKFIITCEEGFYSRKIFPNCSRSIQQTYIRRIKRGTLFLHDSYCSTIEHHFDLFLSKISATGNFLINKSVSSYIATF